MHRGSAQLLLRHIFTGNGLHDRRACEEHVAGLPLHNNEVGEGRRINGTTGAGAEDDRNLRNNARSHNVPLENFGITGQSIDALLNTRAARVVKPYARCAGPHGHIHHLANLLRHGLRQRPPGYGEILCKDINEPPVDRTVTCYHTISVSVARLHAEVITTVGNEHVELLETVFVEKHLDPLAGSIFALGVLGLYALLSAAQPGLLAQLYELRDFVLIFTHCIVNYEFQIANRAFFRMRVSRARQLASTRRTRTHRPQPAVSRGLVRVKRREVITNFCLRTAPSAPLLSIWDAGKL